MTAAEAIREHDPRPTNGLPSFSLFLPQSSLTNAQIESWQVVTPGGNILTAESILKRTGISERFIADTPGQDTLFMANTAVENLLRTVPGVADVIFATATYPIGASISDSINQRFGLQAHQAIDVFAACSGFARTLAAIKAEEELYKGQRIMIVSTEKHSDKVFKLKEGIQNDPSLSQTIFSDGATAFYGIYGKNFQVLSARQMSLPKYLADALRMPVDYSLLAGKTIVEEIPASNSGYIEQDGKRVYKTVMEYIPAMVRETVTAAGLIASDIDLVIPHQGSIHVVSGLQARLPDYEVFSDVEQGNFSSASIPKAMATAIRQEKIGKGSIVVLPGFGAGLFAATVVVRL